MTSQSLKLAIVRTLNGLCQLIDDVAYRPAVVKLMIRMPRYWCCQLSHLSMKLDDRWQTGFWQPPNAPPAPNGPCDACGRRAGWLEVGGHYEGLEDDSAEEEYLVAHPVTLCSWCHLRIDTPPENAEDLDRLLQDARSRSISWQWRWHPG
jgi:hypothetical protein